MGRCLVVAYSLRVPKVGSIDDPVWTEPPPVVTRSTAARTKHNRWLFVAAPAVLLALGGWFLFTGGPGSGDPGGRIMQQLTPTASALPGYGTVALPWVQELPPSLDASYIIKIEPRPDSCDGRPGTQGWSPVAVQSRFQWGQGLPALIAYMEPRLAKLGWSIQAEPQLSVPPNQNWAKTLRNGTRANLSVTQEGGSTSAVWQLVAQGASIGESTGC
jgi:hypothetical protein